MLFQLKKLPEIFNLTRLLKLFWILYIDQIIVYNAFYSKLTFYIIKDRCQMQALKVFRSPVLHKLSSPHYRYIRKMRRGDRLPLTQRRATGLFGTLDLQISHVCKLSEFQLLLGSGLSGTTISFVESVE